MCCSHYATPLGAPVTPGDTTGWRSGVGLLAPFVGRLRLWRGEREREMRARGKAALHVCVKPPETAGDARARTPWVVVRCSWCARRARCDAWAL
eukprot:6377475-Prymnesium_polylepis.1